METRVDATQADANARSGARPWFRILGPLDVGVGDEPLHDLGGPKQRELLALLLIHANQFVPAGRLADALWDGEPPASAEVTLRSHVSRLRRRLDAVSARDALVTRSTGYALRVDADQVDAHLFERLLGLGQEALGLGEPARAAELLHEALSQWRGDVLEDLGSPLFAAAECARLEELRLVALETRVDADLRRGRHRNVVAELERLVAAHPFRERLRGQLMLALYRSGRQVDALAAYATARRQLGDELGLDPGPALVELETAILRHDPALGLPDPGAVVGVPTEKARAVRELNQPSDALFAAARRMPMVGRSVELRRLGQKWRRVREGGRGVVLVSGEAGIGKTRLVAEFAHEASGEDLTFMIGRCDPVAPVPYQPLAEALRSTAAIAELVATAPEAVGPRLGQLLDAPSAAPAAESSPIESSPKDDERDRLTLFRACEWLLGQVSATGPVLLVVEDCERLDPASSLLLRHLVARLPQRVLLVLCYRDPPGTRHLPLLELLADVSSWGMADQLVLRPLPMGEIAALVEAVNSVVPSEGFVHTLWQKTGGNPYYATEVVRHLPAHGGWDHKSTAQVPSGVRDVLRRRLRMLSAATQQVVYAAAVLGREAEFGLLAEVVELPENLAIEALEEAVGAGFLIEAGRSWKGSHAFPHDLTHEAVFGDIGLPRRQRLHLRAARALLRRMPSTGRNVTGAALHIRKAGPAADPLEAAELSLRAADEARRVYAWEEAVVHAEAAVEILGRAGAEPARQGAAEVYTALLRLKSSIGYARAVEHLEAALEHYRAAGDDEAVGSTHSRLGGALCTHHSVMDIPRAMEHFAAAERLLGASSAFHLHRGVAQAAMYGLRTGILDAASRKAHRLATERERPELVALAGWGGAWARFNQGELDEAASIHEAMWATAHERADAYLGWASVNAAALCATEYLLDPAHARMWARRGVTQPRFETFRHPHDAVLDQLVLALGAMGEPAAARQAAERLPDDAVGRRLLLFLEGRWEQADRAWTAALAADESVGDRHDAALSARWLAGVRLLLGKEDEAMALLRRALALGIDGPQVPTELMARAELARLLGTRGEVAEAVEHLGRCDEILAGSADWRGVAGVVELARGAVAAARGDRGGSDEAHVRAMDAFTAYHLPWRRAGALHAWGQLLVTAGETDEAAGRHRAAVAVYDQIGAAARWRRPLTRP